MNINSKFLGFWVVFLLLHTGLFALHFAPTSHDPFDATATADVITAFGELPVGGKVQAKYQHASNRAPYAVGLFGNSRIVMVQHEDLGMQEGEMFNFAVGGTSFLQSVSLLEELAKAGKAPDLSIISIDHPELQFFNYPYWPEPVLNILNVADDSLLYLSQANGSFEYLIDGAKFLMNNLMVTWLELRKKWNFDNARRYFRYLTVAAGDHSTDAAHSALPPEKVLYRKDGSVTQKPAELMADLNLVVVNKLSRYSNAYLENYLTKLGGLVETYGLNVVIYESPIHPDLMKKLEVEASPYAKATREKTLTKCSQAGLDCRLAAILAGNTGKSKWPDCCHAPRQTLGAYLRNSIIDQKFN